MVSNVLEFYNNCKMIIPDDNKKDNGEEDKDVVKIKINKEPSNSE